MWVRHNVINVGLLHSSVSASFITLSPWFSELLESSQEWELTFLPTVAFRATKIQRILRADVPLDIRAIKNLEDIMLPVNYRSWQRSFLELPILSTVGVDIPVYYSFKSYKYCQQWEMTFLSTVAFRTTKMPTTLRADVPVAIRGTINREGTMLSVIYQNWQRIF